MQLIREWILSTQEHSNQVQSSQVHASQVHGNQQQGDLSGDADIRHWVRVAIDAADEKLGQDTEAFFVGEIMAITDWFVITSGRNNRQVRAIVEAVEEALTEAGGPKPVRIEGRDTWSWVLMDFGFFVVHVFTDESRGFYDLERLWNDVPRLDKVVERPTAERPSA